MKNNKLDYYIFIEELNEKIIKNIIKLKKRKLRLKIIILDKNLLIIHLQQIKQFKHLQ